MWHPDPRQRGWRIIFLQPVEEHGHLVEIDATVHFWYKVLGLRDCGVPVPIHGLLFSVVELQGRLQTQTGVLRQSGV
jgi:hypothetical protein